MREGFGARLRQQREQHDITLATIAEQTKIKLSLLDQLERDDISHWPTGIFRRAFVRSYAAAIGIDPEAAVREFLEQFPEPVETIEQPAENGNGHGTSTSGPPTRFRYLVASLLARLRGQEIEIPAHEIIARSAPLPAPVVTVHASHQVVEVEEASARTPEPPPSAAAGEPPAVPEPIPLPAPDVTIEATPGLDLQLAARICTDFSRIEEIGQIPPLLQDSTRLLRAIGLIVWVWEGSTSELTPMFTQGYSEYVLTLLPRVSRESDNATAAAFRTAQTTVVTSTEHTSGALVVPLLSPAGCIGALAIELTDGAERQQPVRALANFMAAELTRLINRARPLEIPNRRFA